MKRLSLLLNIVLCVGLCACSRQKAIVDTEHVQRYCNPLSMEIGQGGNASGDVSVFEYEGKYYMFCTGGGAWVSCDMLNWEFYYVAHVPVAPDVVYYKGKFYMTGNTSPIYVSDNPLGPYQPYSDWKDAPTIEEGWNGAFDTHIFIDDDGKPYLFWPGRGVSGIYASALDPDDISRFVGEVHHLFGFDPSHKWECYGETNEYQAVAWIEGPWIFKYNGTYYLQYSASGTQWKTYAEGYYKAKSILGPYTYANNNPLLRKTEGLVTGTAHGSMLEGPDGGIWQFYTIVLSNPPGGRRIGMDRVFVNKNGNLSCTITDTPQWGPSGKKNRKAEDCGSQPVTINKMNAMNALSRYSSQTDGHFASYALDNNSGTWWVPSKDDETPQLTIELSPATRFDVVELFYVDAMRLMFSGSRRRMFDPSAQQIYRYRLEVSLDGINYTTALDMTKNQKAKDTIFDEFNPIRCRFVRLTITDWPKSSPLGVIEFTVFGKPADTLPAAVAIPTSSDLPADTLDRHR